MRALPALNCPAVSPAAFANATRALWRILERKRISTAPARAATQTTTEQALRLIPASAQKIPTLLANTTARPGRLKHRWLPDSVARGPIPPQTGLRCPHKRHLYRLHPRGRIRCAAPIHAAAFDHNHQTENAGSSLKALIPPPTVTQIRFGDDTPLSSCSTKSCRVAVENNEKLFRRHRSARIHSDWNLAPVLARISISPQLARALVNQTVWTARRPPQLVVCQSAP